MADCSHCEKFPLVPQRFMDEVSSDPADVLSSAWSHGIGKMVWKTLGAGIVILLWSAGSRVVLALSWTELAQPSHLPWGAHGAPVLVQTPKFNWSLSRIMWVHGNQWRRAENNWLESKHAAIKFGGIELMDHKVPGEWGWLDWAERSCIFITAPETRTDEEFSNHV